MFVASKLLVYEQAVSRVKVGIEATHAYASCA